MSTNAKESAGAATLSLPPVAIAVVLATTAIPAGFRHSYAQPTFDLEFADVLLNIVLYLPVGASFARWSPSRVGLFAALASVIIEGFQGWHADRYPSAIDVVANAVGAFAGCALVRAAAIHGELRLPLSRALGVVAAVGATGLAAVWMFPRVESTLTGWDSGAALLIGNELTGNRPWEGTISDIVIAVTPLSPAEMVQATEGSLPGPRRRLIWTSPGERRLAGATTPLFDQAVAADIAAGAQQQNALTVVARIRPANVSQDGPARIVTFSRSPYERNFTLAQERRHVVFRIRTPVSGPNGTEVELATDDVLVGGRDTTVAAAYDGRVARIYVDGREQARLSFAARGCVVPDACETDLPALSALLGFLVTVAAFAVVRPPSSAVWPIGIAAAAAAAAVSFYSGAARVAPPVSAWMPAVAAACALVVAAARSSATLPPGPSL